MTDKRKPPITQEKTSANPPKKQKTHSQTAQSPTQTISNTKTKKVVMWDIEGRPKCFDGNGVFLFDL